ncbi:anti-sigma factor family protein [Williamsia sp. M5A3_1d]
MTDDPSGPDPFPGPPFPIDLIADLHAGVLPDDEAAALWPRVRADPAARRVLDALDATRADLAAVPVADEPPPAAVSAAIEATLAGLDGEQGASASAPRTEPEVESLADARARRRDAGRRRGLLIALAAAAVISVVTLVVAISTASMSSQGTVTNAEPSSTPTSSGDRTGADTSPVALLSVLGRTGASFDDGPADTARLQRCLSANGVSPSTPVLGSGTLTVDGGRRTVVLLGTGQAGRFDALVVGTDCDTGRPSLISRQQIGGAPPTR